MEQKHQLYSSQKGPRKDSRCQGKNPARMRKHAGLILSTVPASCLLYEQILWLRAVCPALPRRRAEFLNFQQLRPSQKMAKNSDLPIRTFISWWQSFKIAFRLDSLLCPSYRLTVYKEKKYTWGSKRVLRLLLAWEMSTRVTTAFGLLTTLSS